MRPWSTRRCREMSSSSCSSPRIDSQLVVGERRRIHGRHVPVVVRQVARALEDRPLERSRGLQLEGSGGYLTAQAGDTLAAQVVDAGVEAPAPLRDGILLILRLADQAVEIVVAQGG